MFGWKHSARIAASTRSRVSGRTTTVSFSTFDTVPTETFASLATSTIVARRRFKASVPPAPLNGADRRP